MSQTENERLPTELGWSKKTGIITREDVNRVTQVIANSTSLLTASSAAAVAPVQANQRRNLHGR